MDLVKNILTGEDQRELPTVIAITVSIKSVFWGTHMTLQTLIIVSLVFAGFFLVSAPERASLINMLGFRRKAGR